ncbi:MAG: M48 family metallopeptidase [Bacteroidota bacterium]
MQKYLILLLYFAWSIAATAQSTEGYQPLQCSGNIPEEFTTPSTEKYKAEIRKIDKKNLKKRDRKDRKAFALQSNFALDDLLQSGMVLFNDPVSNYLNEMLDQVVKANPQYKKKVHAYALRSSGVNAFATARGTIFVTLGLLAQLENEAQLAYVLSHEMIHVQEGHTLDLFLEAKNIERQSNRKQVMSESRFDEEMVAKNRYSKDLEMEADTKGIDLFLKTKYGTGSLKTVFDVLKYAYLPFDDVAFEPSFFESELYKFPDTYWAGPINPIVGDDENGDDNKSSHPNIGKRRQALATALEKSGKPDGPNFILSETRFKELQQTARYELPMLYLRRNLHPEAIYSAYLLLQKTPAPYLYKCVAKSLYLRAKYLNETDIDASSNPAAKKRAEKTEGQSHKLFRFLEQLSGQETTVLALRYAWMQHQLHPEDTELKAIVDDLFIELGRYEKSLSAFASTAAPAPTVVDTTRKTNAERSKYDKINEQKGATPTSSESTSYTKLAFAEFLQDTAFKKAFDEGQKEYTERHERRVYYETPKGEAELAKRHRKEEKKGLRLNVPKIAIVDPFYLKLDARRENAVQYIQSEDGHENFHDLIEVAAKASGLKTTILDVNDLKENQAERFNDIRFLNEWFGEQVTYDNLTLTPGLNQSKVNAIAEKYGTDYFLWTGVISLREKNPNAALMILLGVIFYPALPFAIIKAVKPEYDMLYYAVLYDVKTGRRQVVRFNYFDKRDTDAVLKAHLYDTFAQIKRK